MTWEEVIRLTGLFTDLLSKAFWPTVVIYALWRYFPQIKSLLDRIRKGGGLGLTAEFDPQPQQTPEQVKKIAEEAEPTPALRAELDVDLVPVPKQEPQRSYSWTQALRSSIRGDLREKKLPVDRAEELLLANLAATQADLAFERILKEMFGSQLHALRVINTKDGYPLDIIKLVYETAVRRYPELHDDRTFEQWLSYLTVLGLVEVRGVIEMAHVTDKGREFLNYVKQQGYPQPPG